METIIPATLYVVATPIGHRDDITVRALNLLRQVDLIAAEDTRHTRQLLQHHGIDTRLTSLHGHNEAGKAQFILQRCQQGDAVALVSDAGTPLISDPGQTLLSVLQQNGIKVVPVPGPCAAVTALSASSIAADRFVFEGFLPARPGRRKKRLQTLLTETRAMVFYEAVHRMSDFLAELIAVFGADRQATVARELTKAYESIQTKSLSELQQHFQTHQDQLRGEFVVVVAGAADAHSGDAIALSLAEYLQLLMKDSLPPSKAASQAAKLTSKKKAELYQLALNLKRAE